MTTAVHALRYLHPSALRPRRLALATSGGATPDGEAAHPRFSDGLLRHPDAAAAALLAVADVAAARYHRPVGADSLDPVVTADGDRLRFESFSGCGGVHARLDGAGTGHGTTNVDVNAPLREALRLRTPGQRLELAVGAEEPAVGVGTDTLVERKVPLPDCWLKGFAETQVITARFDLRPAPRRRGRPLPAHPPDGRPRRRLLGRPGRPRPRPAPRLPPRRDLPARPRTPDRPAPAAAPRHRPARLRPARHPRRAHRLRLGTRPPRRAVDAHPVARQLPWLLR